MPRKQKTPRRDATGAGVSGVISSFTCTDRIPTKRLLVELPGSSEIIPVANPGFRLLQRVCAHATGILTDDHNDIVGARELAAAGLPIHVGPLTEHGRRWLWIDPAAKLQVLR